MAVARQLIDWHTHWYLPEHVDAASVAAMEARGLSTSDAGPDQHRRGVPDGGAEKFVVIRMPTRWGRGIPNDFIAEYVARYPGRAVGFAAVDPSDADAPDELDRSITKLGLRGLKLSPVYHGFDPWSPAAWRLYEVADGLRVPVMFHMGGAYDPEAALEWGSPLLLDRVCRAFPRLRMIVAHLGQPMMQETVMLMRKNENVFADLSARFHRRWQLYSGLQTAIEYRVTDRILFGSDFPVMTTRAAADAFRAINEWGDGVRLPTIPPELIDQILYERPLGLVGLA
jgi:predicted TIM-barrel fold metal-dependent hydrolase